VSEGSEEEESTKPTKRLGGFPKYTGTSVGIHTAVWRHGQCVCPRDKE